MATIQVVNFHAVIFGRDLFIISVYRLADDVLVTKTNLVVHEDKNRVPYVKVRYHYKFVVLPSV